MSPDPNGDLMRIELPDILGPINVDAVFGNSEKPVFQTKVVWAVKSDTLKEWVVVGPEE